MRLWNVSLFQEMKVAEKTDGSPLLPTWFKQKNQILIAKIMKTLHQIVFRKQLHGSDQARKCSVHWPLLLGMRVGCGHPRSQIGHSPASRHPSIKRSRIGSLFLLMLFYFLLYKNHKALVIIIVCHYTEFK